MNNRGNAAIIVLLLLVAGIVVASAFAFYTLKNQGALPGYGTDQNYSYTPSPEVTISPIDDLDTIQTELDSTSEGSVDAEFNELESQAASL
jgi:hypothetical protein